MTCNKTGDGNPLDYYSKSVFKKTLLIKTLCFERKMKREIKLNFGHLFELPTLEITGTQPNCFRAGLVLSN